VSSIEYLPILIFVLVGIGFPVGTILVSKALHPHRPEATKLSPYECGIETTSDARGRSSVHFYVIAVLFVVFDVETIFLFPWAVRYKVLGWFGFAEMAVFLGILVVAYAYAWKRGALEWA
jgi:NADH-quinone oxidoreductase subunit A